MRLSANTLISRLPGIIILAGPKTRAKHYLKDMNKKMIQYLQKCPAEQLKLWTWLFAATDDNDCITINLGEVRMIFKLTPKVFAKVLGLDEMQGQQFITYQHQDKSHVIIKFNKRNEQNAVNQQLQLSSGNDNALIVSAANKVKLNGHDQSFENELHGIISGNDNALIVNTAEKPEIIGVRKIEFSVQLKDWLIDDYTAFFVSLQKSRNALAGAPNAPVLPPKFDGADIKHFKLITDYFRKLKRPSGSNAPLTDEEVRMCFQKIYSCWEGFDSFVQNGVKVQQIWFNLNNIVTQLSVPRKTKNHHRNVEFDKKAERTGQRDFSHILHKRAEGN